MITTFSGLTTTVSVFKSSDFYDPDGFFFKNGEDEFGGTYNENLEYLPAKEHEKDVERIKQEIEEDDDEWIKDYILDNQDDSPKKPEKSKKDQKLTRKWKEIDPEEFKEYLENVWIPETTNYLDQKNPTAL